MKNEVLQKFLCKTEDTGRFIIQSKVTGKTYFIEPIDDSTSNKRGRDMDSVTKKITGDYENARKGAVRKEHSLITAENGFTNISFFEGSPLEEIERRDLIYQEEEVT